MSLDKNNRSAQLEALAGRLASAWLNNLLIEDLVENELPQNRAEAYLVQDLMSQQIGQLITGWKVGATSAKMRELDGHTDVIPGRIFKSVTYHGRQITLPMERFPRARVETEFAFRLLADCPVDQAPWSAENSTKIPVQGSRVGDLSGTLISSSPRNWLVRKTLQNLYN